MYMYICLSSFSMISMIPVPHCFLVSFFMIFEHFNLVLVFLVKNCFIGPVFFMPGWF